MEKTGIELIAQERKRQIEVEGWTPEHDSEHGNQEIASAAACYATPKERRSSYKGSDVPTEWPWEFKFWKPTPKDRKRELVKAGALIAAEIDRLQNL